MIFFLPPPDVVVFSEPILLKTLINLSLAGYAVSFFCS